jgi:hypothetical protein
MFWWSSLELQRLIETAESTAPHTGLRLQEVFFFFLQFSVRLFGTNNRKVISYFMCIVKRGLNEVRLVAGLCHWPRT